MVENLLFLTVNFQNEGLVNVRVANQLTNCAFPLKYWCKDTSIYVNHHIDLQMVLDVFAVTTQNHQIQRTLNLRGL